MPLTNNIKLEIYKYCNNYLPDAQWYENEIDFIEDINLKKRIIEEFKKIEQNKLLKRRKAKCIARFCVNILIRIFVVASVAVISYFGAKKVNADCATSFSIIVTIVSIAFSIPEIVKNVYKKSFLSMKIDEER